MRNQALVFKYDQALMSKIHEKPVVIFADDCRLLHQIMDEANRSRNHVHCIVINQKGALSTIPVQKEWQGIPIAIYAQEFGNFKEILGKLPLLRDLNLRVFLSTDNRENFTNLHILASLGVDCGIYFGEKPIDWEAMNDLMTYSIYGKVRHASIEPFRYIVSAYHPHRFTEYATVYFNNPERYLHIDADENIALSSEDLKNGKYVATGFENLNRIQNDETFYEKLFEWQNHFQAIEGCSICPAWRVCLGKFSTQLKDNPGCSKFFEELMDGADFYLARQNQSKTKELWQP
jgi:hypothetical protein